MRMLLKTAIMVVALVLIWATGASSWTSWQQSPNNWKNSQRNWDNNSRNWNNSPNNWQNNSNNINSNRIIRDNRGRAQGYVTPKAGGGVNIYDTRGNRLGYSPGSTDNW